MNPTFQVTGSNTENIKLVKFLNLGTVRKCPLLLLDFARVQDHKILKPVVLF